MSNNETDPGDESGPTREFYVPATFQFATDSGRIERVLVGLFEERGNLEARTVTDEAIPEFYIPAMFQFATDPGRIERFVLALFEERGDRERREIPEEFVGDFYLPAVSPDGFRRLAGQERAPLVPASEVSSGNDKPGTTGN